METHDVRSQEVTDLQVVIGKRLTENRQTATVQGQSGDRSHKHNCLVVNQQHDR